ncbi:hypothetical protein Bbelb_269180 [Branchiostoma belcheri]|nr:hypothetical protein Bbelb_269180 [Branchiostoma belcheri]
MAWQDGFLHVAGYDKAPAKESGGDYAGNTVLLCCPPTRLIGDPRAWGTPSLISKLSPRGPLMDQATHGKVSSRPCPPCFHPDALSRTRRWAAVSFPRRRPLYQAPRIAGKIVEIGRNKGRYRAGDQCMHDDLQGPQRRIR